LAGVLGFVGQRPERDFRGGGPDVLWSVGGLDYWVIECKSGSDHNPISKRDADQLSGAIFDALLRSRAGLQETVKLHGG
jgi:hypothetical protein